MISGSIARRTLRKVDNRRAQKTLTAVMACGPISLRPKARMMDLATPNDYFWVKCYVAEVDSSQVLANALKPLRRMAAKVAVGGQNLDRFG